MTSGIHPKRGTWIDINLDNVRHNLKEIRQNLEPDTEMIAVVKADGYGHGAIQVGKQALRSGATQLAVATLEEGIELREADIKADILVFGYVFKEDVVLAVKYGLTLTFFQKEWLKQIKSLAFTGELKLHMKWDTGMGRIGLREDRELISLLKEIRKDMRLKLTGIYTHFATADMKDESYYHLQKERFQSFYETFKNHWPEDVLVHIGNSAAAIRFPGDMYDAVRIGISLYGLYPSEFIKGEKIVELKPALSLHSRIIHMKKLEKGEKISYGGTYMTKDVEWIATIPIGYADGFPRHMQDFHVLINGKRMPIVGRICMDQMMVKTDQYYPPHTEVTMIGRQKDEIISADDIASFLDTINYEIPCMLNGRILRHYT